MTRQPRGDSWDAVLAHRPADTRQPVRDRFVAAGVTPDQVAAALADAGDALHAAVAGGAKDWADGFGGPLAAALLAAEVSALAAHLNSRASAVRALAVDALLDDYSAVSVAASLGVSRQKVYDLARPAPATTFIPRTPWSHS